MEDYKDLVSSLSTITFSNLPIFYNFKKHIDESREYELEVTISVNNKDTLNYIKSVLDWISEENPLFRWSWRIDLYSNLIFITPKEFFSQNKLFSSLFEETQFDLSVTVEKRYRHNRYFPGFLSSNDTVYVSEYNRSLFRILPSIAGKGIFFYKQYSVEQYPGVGLIFRGFSKNKELRIGSNNFAEIHLFIIELLGLSNYNPNLEEDYIALINLIKMDAINNKTLVDYILNNKFLLTSNIQIAQLN